MSFPFLLQKVISCICIDLYRYAVCIRLFLFIRGIIFSVVARWINNGKFRQGFLKPKIEEKLQLVGEIVRYKLSIF
jgi:hypothetical protein